MIVVFLQPNLFVNIDAIGPTPSVTAGKSECIMLTAPCDTPNVSTNSVKYVPNEYVIPSMIMCIRNEAEKKIN